MDDDDYTMNISDDDQDENIKPDPDIIQRIRANPKRRKMK